MYLNSNVVLVTKGVGVQQNTAITTKYFSFYFKFDAEA